MGRVLAIDYGQKRVGLAVTDPMRIIATALDTVPACDVLEYIKKYISTNDVDCIVIGMPLQMNGQASDSQRYILPFIGRLRAVLPQGMAIEYADERFTSVLAQRAIREAGVPKMRRQTDKGLVDRVSAVIILQWWMEKIV